jgi:hypothetical protein
MANKAVKIHACTFVKTAASKVFIYNQFGTPVDVKTEELAEAERSAFIAMQDAFNLAITKNGAFEFENFVCPWDYGTNNAVMAQNGLFTFPSAIITATYADGSRKIYVLGDEFIDKLTGAIWTPEKIYPYIRILLLNLTPKDQTDSAFLCKLLPPLCSVGGWVWLGLAIGATLKASSAQNFGRGLWGTGAALLWHEWYQRGGLDQLKTTIGISGTRVYRAKRLQA